MLTPRRLRLGVDLFAAAVAASIGIALAGLFWRLAGDPGQRLGAAPIAARPRRAVDLAPLIALAPFGAAAPVATASADQTLVLRGITLADSPGASAALVAVGGAAPVAFYVGQALGGGTIESIAMDHVVILGGGARQMLAFPDRSGSAALGSGSPLPPPANGVAPPAPISVVTTAPAAANPAAALAALGIVDAGGVLRVTQATPSGRASGLTPGDQITRLNGAPVGDMLQNPASMQAALTSGTAQVEVLRAGQRVTLSVGTR